MMRWKMRELAKFMKGKKGVSPLIATVLVIMISVIVIGLVIHIGLPAIDRAKESATLNEALQNMRVLDNLIREVMSEGGGSLRSMDLKVSGGTYKVNEQANSIDFEFDMKSDLVRPGTFVQEGNLMVMRGVNTRAYEADLDGDGATELVLENEVMRVALQKVGSPSSWQSINTKENIKLLNFKETGANVSIADSSIIIDDHAATAAGTGYSKLLETGDHLPKAEALFHISTANIEYDVLYTLQSGADFIIVKVLNAYYK